MRNLIGRMLSAWVLLCFCSHAHSALIKRVAPFEGQVFEGFENVSTTGALSNLMGGLASVTAPMGTSLTVQDGSQPNFWDQHAFEERYFLGASAGRAVPATIEISFDYPVNAFGGSFGHRVHPLLDTTQETAIVFFDANQKVVGRDTIVVGSLPGGVRAHWEFNRSVKRITFTAVAPMVDALTAQLSPLCYRRFTRSLIPVAPARGKSVTQSGVRRENPSE